ncbi:TonB-dependent receptor [Ralstonia pseudosolanacearum]|uniref:TonB-dependent receptor n=1 Tax=Ralstonia pseudosolanacearum TaxID=1310165 RepID=UPI002676A76B|nr:TonB-dependent receptor [Ralstonia pseudosolanacearum]MDO3522928.1 TonB-dependent receptor [Ralstonia pseudosolanacearum]MDO3547378.1 TonB-dependent receptor [Ralstonia pseudosolanacearum]MDO3551927.1 TonB-dependent receptor [Ralstonia pseudosolanacearum]MDO3566291.1 TonB-dependent receptor [Ralstonia pseudosolanacearum]MDO3581658.1 TonB-dependent receptor [Ralstonia pseudosolanacearum]
MRARPAGVLWMALGYGMAGPLSALAGGLQQPEVQLETTTVVGSAAAAAATGEAASQGYVPRAQLENRPLLRPGELLETVPGLIVTQHSGDGKANQYFLRGFNLDHGTDLATTVAGMPVNMRTHAHGQGYTDLNFLIPELVSGIAYKKGTYFAEEGDFSAAGAVRIDYADKLPHGLAQFELGEYGYRRGLLADSRAVGPDTLLYGFEWLGENGPWVVPEGVHKLNGVLRYTLPLGGGERVTVTGMAYRNTWQSTDQVPQRAIDQGLIARFGAIDPTDGGMASRYSLSADWLRPLADGQLKANAYVIKSRLTLFSNFTDALANPMLGDQFEQFENRVTTGINASRTWFGELAGHDSETEIGSQTRYDRLDPILLADTVARQPYALVRSDTVDETSTALYLRNSIQWRPWLRTLAGLRADQFWYRVGSSNPRNSGSGAEHIVAPKLGVVLSPTAGTDVFVNWGRGYHSNDVRGATTTVDPASGNPVRKVSVLVPATGYEVGVRTKALARDLQLSASLWRLDIGSELVFAGDTGTTQPSRPSRRTGVELAAYYKPSPDLILDADAAFSRARFRDADPAGDHIPEAIQTTASAGMSWTHGRWTLGARLRYFGPRPLIEDNSVRSASSFLVNLKAGYRVRKNVRVFVEVLNALNRKANDIDYDYASLLKGETSPVDASGAATGINDRHIHPAEPRTVRAGIAWTF